ncbi:guanine nucleotide-binding protein alpha-1 subunit [[Candida] jaroonii]|uniref:Guanine nucleotide-binding protein alpha-1 subunit n=1 Tax=[Candida] jaroonii TaxID=467808 RepID=A0ACA9YAB4_9ASCO|nr:guanine nucleotide-binding protein alpha-1 subunit [[Candida] jaroonii]
MGCTASVAVDEEDPFLADERINDAINQRLSQSKKAHKNEIKLLLLGAGESGKSTVLKQLKVLHKGGFTQQERLQYSNVIWVDTIQSMKILIVQAKTLGIQLECNNKDSPLAKYKKIILKANALQQIDTSIAGGDNFLNDYVVRYSEGNKIKRRKNSTGLANSSFFTQDRDDDSNILDYNELIENGEDFSRDDVAESIDMLWKYDTGIQQCFARSNEFQLESSAKYYFEKVYNFANPGYICNDIDILKGRIKTTGITETNFNINSFKFKVLDAGGQRSERKKWIHCFDNITAILFVVAISEYDQMLFEDERVNRMHEAIILFDSLCNSRWFINTPFILFLNKIDLFEDKIKKSPLSFYFPDFKGNNDNFEQCIKFFEQIFMKINKTQKPIYVHRTCATDSTSMKFVLSAVTDLIINENLRKSGLI